MPFKDFPEASKQYLDENGNLVAQLTGEDLAKWKKWNEDMMNENAEYIKKRLGIV